MFMMLNVDVDLLYPCLWGQLSATSSNGTEVAPWTIPCCCRPQAAMENDARDGRFVTSHPLQGSTL